jgi:hypothetical protein
MELKETILRKSIPVIINSFNQLHYLKNSIECFVKNGFKNIIILDNGSTYPPLINFYNQISVHSNENVTPLVLYYNANRGPRYFHQLEIFRQICPFIHIFTDPDIGFDILAPNYCSYLLELSHKYKMFKVGSALRLPTGDELKPDMYLSTGRGNEKMSVQEWESQFWLDEVEEGVFKAPIDTTLHLFNPEYFNNSTAFISGLRVALLGFQVKHLPWFKNDPVDIEEATFYKKYAGAFNNW